MSYRPIRAALVVALATWLVPIEAPAQVEATPGDDAAIVDLPEPSDAERVFADWLNGRRRATGAQPLEPNRDLFDLAQGIADTITVRARVEQADLEPDGLLDALRERGYPAVRVVIAQAVAGGSWRTVIEQWAEADPATFERLLHPELSHLAIGLGDVRGQPLHVVLAAATADVALERRTEPLRDRPERVRRSILDRVNREREAAGQPPLSARRLLDRVAQSYAETMLERGFYGHTTPEGQTVLDRVRATGYRPLRVGENIASGQTSAEQVMNGWIDSPEHRANILHPAFRELGVGVAAGRGPDDRYRVYWVQVFADPR